MFVEFPCSLTHRAIAPAMRMAVLGALLLAVLLFPTSIIAEICGDNDPASPVPQFREGVRLWPDGFEPTKPGQTLPRVRDSSDYISLSTPGNASGHELFLDLDIVENHVYMAYNAGFQVWSIATAANAEDPLRIAFRDGWLGDFESFPMPYGESEGFVEAISAHKKSNGDVLIALSAKDPVGPSFWKHAADGNVTRIAQDQSTQAADAKAVERGSTVYGLIASTDDGVVVYNAETGFRHGTLAGDTLSKRHVTFLERDGKLWVAASNGTAIRAKIWEVPNPTTPGTAIERFDGEALGSGVRDLELFEHNGTPWLAFIQQQQIKIYDVSECLDANGCASLGSPVYIRQIPGLTPSGQYLTFSRATGDVPFLYYGYQANTTAGTKRELLLNLSHLGTTNEINEVTDGGGIYTDGCGNQVDYWGDYYDGNEHGLRNFSPRAGMFSGNFFYRAARAIFDVHLWTAQSQTPSVTTSISSPPPYWMSTAQVSDPIPLTASAQNCEGSGVWTWFDDDPLSSLSSSGPNATLDADLCAAAECPDRAILAWALKSDCSGDPDLIQNRASLLVADPRVRVDTLQIAPSGSVFPVGTVFQASADLAGKPPFTYSWVVRDATGADIANGAGTEFSWDSSGSFIPTCADDPDCLFADGFETGDALAWSEIVGASPSVLGRLPARSLRASDTSARALDAARRRARTLRHAKGLLTATFTLELTATNLDGTEQAVASTEIVLEPPGPLGFADPPITVTPLGGGAFQLQANSLNTSEWRWTLEDPDGDRTFEWGEETDLLTYTWSQVGIFQVQVEIRNDATVPGGELAAAVDVEVADLGLLAVTRFEVDGAASPACRFLPLDQIWECAPNAAITFFVETEGNPSLLEFDWDGDGIFEDSVNANGSFVHTYTAIGAVAPQTRAVLGSTTSTATPLSPGLTIF